MALPSNNMNLNLYRIFYTVAKTKSFSESSKTLHISQPAISKHIQNLEYELKTQLFYRTNRGIELTPEATNLLIYVEKAYNYLMLGERELEESKELTKGRISIGVPTFLNKIYLNKYIKNFMKEHPNITIEITNSNEKRLLELFSQHAIDLIITTNKLKSNRNNKEYKSIEIRREEYCFAYSKRLPYENINTLEDIITKPLILPSISTKERQSLDNYLNNKDIVINPILELDQDDLILTYTKDDLGIGYLPRSIVINNPELQEIILEEELPTEVVNIIYNENTLTNASRAFITILTEKNMLTAPETDEEL